MEHSLFDSEAEQILLDELLYSEKRHEVISLCFPSMFYSQATREIFEVIKELGKDANLFSVTRELSRRHAEKVRGIDSRLEYELVLDQLKAKPDEAYWRGRYEPINLVRYLKELLYRRLAQKRAQNILQIVSSERAANIDRSIYQQVEKLMILGKTLIRTDRNSMDDIAQRTSDRVNSQYDIIRTGFEFINDKMMGLTRRQVSSLLAYPKHLKSSFADQLVSTTVEKGDYRGLIISLEDPAEERVKRICARILGISLEDMRFKRVRLEREDILKVFKVVLKGQLHILDVRDVLTAEQAATAISDIKPDLAAIDHLQKFQLQDIVIGLIHAVKALEVAAAQNDCHIFITSQVSDKKIQGRDIKRSSAKSLKPTASDAQWTSALYQSSSEMFILYWPYQLTHNIFERHLLYFDIVASRYADAVGEYILEIDADKSNFKGRIIQ